MNEADKARFWSKVDCSNPSACWPWTAGKNAQGYGHFWLNGKTVKASRLAYRISKGEIPSGSHVCHRCDNPACMNPFHLFLGTARENMLDKCAKGRAGSVRGITHPAHRLTEADVIEIRRQRLAGYTLTTIASRFGVSFPHVSAICSGDAWAHVPMVAS